MHSTIYCCAWYDFASDMVSQRRGVGRGIIILHQLGGGGGGVILVSFAVDWADLAQVILSCWPPHPRARDDGEVWSME